MWSRCKQQSCCCWPRTAAKRPAGCIRGWQPHFLEVPQLSRATGQLVLTHIACYAHACSDSAQTFPQRSHRLDCASRTDSAAAKPRATDKMRDTGDWSSPGLAAPVDDAAPRLVHWPSAGSPVQGLSSTNSRRPCHVLQAPWLYQQRCFPPSPRGRACFSLCVWACMMRSCLVSYPRISLAGTGKVCSLPQSHHTRKVAVALVPMMWGQVLPPLGWRSVWIPVQTCASDLPTSHHEWGYAGSLRRTAASRSRSWQ